MGCVVEFSEPFLRFELNHNQYKQKLMLDVLVRNSHFNLFDMAAIIDVSSTTLQNVYEGTEFLEGKPANSLMQLFLIFLGGF